MLLEMALLLGSWVSEANSTVDWHSKAKSNLGEMLAPD